MINRIEYHYLAEKELNDAMDYYEDQKEGLGFSFEKMIKDKIEIIKNHPERYPKRNSNYRETMVKIFPYLIVYRFDKSKHLITVSSIYHTSRNPNYKYRR